MISNTSESPVSLVTPYSEKDAVKALGARWIGSERCWSVPAGMDLVPFARWIPGWVPGSDSASAPETTAGAETLDPAEAVKPKDNSMTPVPLGSSSVLTPTPTPTPTPTALRNPGVGRAPESGALATPKGQSLSSLLNGVAGAVAAAYRDGVWVRAELIDIKVRGGHVYMELAERDGSGTTVAAGKGFVPSRVANKIFPAFEAATGAILAPGIKVLIRVKPVFSPRWGLSLEVAEIDHAFTMGDLAARVQEIRNKLMAEGIFDANKKLAAPEDFNLVLVITPQEAAGLGDFRSDSDRLHAHGVCTFVFAHSRFQGEGAASEIIAAASRGLREILAKHGRLPDAVCVVRGGGAVNDLAWLNDYALAKWVATCPTPVFTGIGHERDSTVLDEISHTKFDTPSKVIAGIREVIVARVQRVRQNMAEIVNIVERAIAMQRRRCDPLIEFVKASAVDDTAKARLMSERLHASVRASASAQIADARQRVPLLMSQAKAGAEKAISDARSRCVTLLAVTSERGKALTQSARQAAGTHMGVVHDRSLLLVESARNASASLFREVMGQGPQKTLDRGFGLVRDQGGLAVTRAAGVVAGQVYEIEFADGMAFAKAVDGVGI